MIISVAKLINKAKKNLEKEEKNLPPCIVETINSLLETIKYLSDQIGLNSGNSSIPPSADSNRDKKPKEKPTDNSNDDDNKSNNKPGGQDGHKGTTLTLVGNPDETIEIELDLTTLPDNQNYQFVRWEIKQVIDIKIRRHVKEYKIAVFKDENGNEFKAKFPKGINAPIQYSPSVKSNAVYMSMYQLIPYERLKEQFLNQFGIALSTGSLFSFNKEALKRLSAFETLVKHKLAISNLIHVDETGININSDLNWIHNASNEDWVWMEPHQKRGEIAMDKIGILPNFKGIMVHDHWKPYFRYKNCQHALCNAHLLRELTRAFEQDNMKWAEEMISFLKDLNIKVTYKDGLLNKNDFEKHQIKYQKILEKAKIECPSPETKDEGIKKRGPIKKTKSRNLLERFIDFEKEILRFATCKYTPFTNNTAERDIRMTKVHQKISGCFRSQKGAKIFCTIRSYIATCKKNNYCIKTALSDLFNGKLPKFIQDEIELIKNQAE